MSKMSKNEERLYIFSWGFMTACVILFLRYLFD